MESSDERPTVTENRPAATTAARGSAAWPSPVSSSTNVGTRTLRRRKSRESARGSAAWPSPVSSSTIVGTRTLKRRKSRESRRKRRTSTGHSSGSSLEISQTETQSKSQRQRGAPRKGNHEAPQAQRPEASAGAEAAADVQRMPAPTSAPASDAGHCGETRPAAPPAAPVEPAARGASASTPNVSASSADGRGTKGAARPAAPPEAPVEHAARAATAATAQPAAVPAISGRTPQEEKLLSFIAYTMIVAAGAMALAGIVASLLSPADESAPDCPPLEKTLADGTVVAATSVGRLIGHLVTVNGVLLSRFLGVPFAESTAGERRFAQPVALHTPCAVREALLFREPCTQWYNGTVSGSEDCLHVNVWAPALPPGPAEAKRALVVVITGEWFESGSNSDRDWSDLAAAGRLVVVAPNHRQGVLGFLRPPDDAATPNVALEDVQSAVAWARGNAATFHADATRLVFVGHGSGAYMLSAAEFNMPNGTVLRAVYHGIVLGSLLPIRLGGGESYSRFSTRVNCSGITDAAAWVRCLRAVSANDLVEASAPLATPLGFAPETEPATTAARTNSPSHTVIAGSDVAAVSALFQERVLPLAQRDGRKPTVQELWDYALNAFPESVAPLIKRDFKPRGMDDLFSLLHHLVSGCPTRRWAMAAPDGYHYMAGSNELFEPPMNLSSLARFVADGTVPALAEDNAWPSLRSSSLTRVITDNGQQLADIKSYCEHTDVF